VLSPVVGLRYLPFRIKTTPEIGFIGSSSIIQRLEKYRYDNAHDADDIGWHHRHINFGTDSEINFQSITAHAARFL